MFNPHAPCIHGRGRDMGCQYCENLSKITKRAMDADNLQIEVDQLKWKLKELKFQIKQLCHQSNDSCKTIELIEDIQTECSKLLEDF